MQGKIKTISIIVEFQRKKKPVVLTHARVRKKLVQGVGRPNKEAKFRDFLPGITESLFLGHFVLGSHER
jgi:hypothetical protein